MTASVRWDKKWDLGDKGAVYEFDIKLPKIDGVTISNDDFEYEALQSIRMFVAELRKRYTWIGQVYQTGLATEAKLKTIATMIEKEQRAFIRYLKSSYGS